jgi:hypothetical protein
MEGMHPHDTNLRLYFKIFVHNCTFFRYISGIFPDGHTSKYSSEFISIGKDRVHDLTPLDSHPGAWAIVTFLRELADNGQAIGYCYMCTVQ